MRSFIKWLSRIPWSYRLAALCFFGFVINTAIFYPGFVSGDVVAQLSQAEGDAQLTNLHPAYIALLWRFLIKITSHPSSLMLLNVALLWTSTYVIGLFIYRKTNSIQHSAFTLTIPLLPYVINISGVMWKDVHLAFLLLFAVSASVLSLTIRRYIFRYVLIVLSLGALVAATLTRYNAIPAILPVVFLVAYNSGVFKTRKVLKSLGVGVAVLVCSLAIMVGLNQAFAVVDKTPTNGPKLDDIVNIAQRDLIASTSGGPGEAFLLNIYDCSEKRNIKLDVIHSCAARSSGAFEVSQPYSHDIDAVWKQSILSNPLRYAEYKVHQYVAFLFPPPNAGYVWHEGVDANTYMADREPFLGMTLGILIKNFWHKYFSFLYEPWFWLVVTVSLLVYATKRKKMALRAFVVSMSLSSLLLLLSYAPTGATIDYRYIYWSALACSVSVLLLWATKELRLPFIHIQYKHTGQDQTDTKRLYERKALAKKERSK